MDIEKKYNEQNIALQFSMNRKLTLLMNKNVTDLAKIIAKESNKRTGTNNKLKKSFTQKKRELRNSLYDFIIENVETGKNSSDKKNDEFLKIQENKFR